MSIISYYLIGIAAYYYFEGWAPLECVYFLTTVATTNGDELQPSTPAGKVFSTIYIVLGITVVMGGIAPLALFVIEPIKERLFDPIAMYLATHVDESMQSLKRWASKMQEAVDEEGSLLGSIPGLSSSLLKVQEWVDMMVGKEEKGAGGEEASEEAADGPRKAAIQAAFKGHVLAIMLFFSVFALGLALSFIFHGYGLTDALYRDDLVYDDCGWRPQCGRRSIAGDTLHFIHAVGRRRRAHRGEYSCRRRSSATSVSTTMRLSSPRC